MGTVTSALTRRELLSSAALLTAATGASSSPSEAPKPVALGYFPDWKRVQPGQLDLSLFSHVCHAFARIGRDGKLVFPRDDGTRALIQVAHSRDVRVLLSLGGAGSNATLTKQAAEPLADALADRMHSFGYDGIDVDWEELASTDDGARMSALVAALRSRLPNALVTMAAPSGNWEGRWFDTASLLPHVDWLNMMTYDFGGPWSHTVEHNAPFVEIPKSVEYWRGKGWPAAKLALGIADYGRRIKASRFGDPAPPGTYVGDEVSYIAVTKLIQDGWQQQYDSTGQAPYVVKPGGGEMVSYDDAASASRKARFARDQGLLGYFFWEITSDFDGKTNVLARAAKQGWDAGG